MQNALKRGVKRMVIKRFPGPEVRERIHNSILSYTTGQISRLDMMSYIYGTLTIYGVKKLAVRNYTVRCTQPVETPIGTFPVIVIEAKQGAHDHCPTCESDAYGYLAGEAPAIKVMCHSCGAFYERRVEKNGKQSSIGSRQNCRRTPGP